MNWMRYLLEANLYLAAFYILYWFLLRKETYYQLSRVYLLATSTLAFFIPLIQLGVLKPQEPITQVANVMPANITFGDLQTIQLSEPAAPAYTLFDYCLMAYAAITVAMLIILCVKITKLMMLKRRNATRIGEDFVLVEVEDDSVAFSFFRYLFIDAKLATSPTIIRHERVHIRQRHSFDIIYLELLKVVNWFNPFVYLLQNSIKELHEYIADQHTAEFESGNDNYAEFLISNAYGVSQGALTNAFFNKNLLKKRITMLYRKRSGRAAKFKYVLVLPLVCALLCISTMAFTDKSYSLVDLLPRHIEIAVPRFSFSTTHLTRGKGVIESDTLVAKPKDATVTDIVLSKHDTTILDTVKSPLIVANGRVLPPSMTRRLKTKAPGEGEIAGLADINPADIKSISVLKGESATALYGPAGAHGVIIITTNEYARGWIDAKIDRANGVRMNQGIRISEKGVGTPGSSDVNSPNVVFTAVEKEPEPANGMQGFYDVLAKAIRYPEEDRKNGTQGKVFLQFIVEKDGNLDSMRVLRAPSPTLGAEAVRAIKTTANWKPGIQNGKPVRVQFTIPVNFSLEPNIGGTGTMTEFYGLQKSIADHATSLEAKMNKDFGTVVAVFNINDNHITSVNIPKGLNKDVDDEIANTIKGYKDEIKTKPGDYSIVLFFGIPQKQDGIQTYTNNTTRVMVYLLGMKKYTAANVRLPAPTVRPNVGLIITDNKIALYIDRNTTKEQLDEYKAKLLERKIDLNIDKIKFDNDKKMSYIKFSVDCNDGFKGSGAYALTEATKVGFYRLYDKNAESPFGVGLSPQ